MVVNFVGNPLADTSDIGDFVAIRTFALIIDRFQVYSDRVSESIDSIGVNIALLWSRVIGQIA